MQLIIECFDHVQTSFFSPNLAEKFTITCNLQRIHLTRFAMHAVWWSLTWCILLRIGGISLPPLLSRWQQLSLSILDELHEANVMVNIKQGPTPTCTSHTSNVPCVHMNTPAMITNYIKTPKVHIPTLPWRSIQHVCKFKNRDCIPTPTPTPPHMTHQQRTMCTHEHTSSVP